MDMSFLPFSLYNSNIMRSFPTVGDAKEFFNVIDSGAGAGVLFAGHERNAPGHRVKTVRDHYLFHYVLEGHGTFRRGRETRALGPGDGFLFAPSVAGQYEADRRSPWVYVWVGFHGRDMARVMPQVGFGEGEALLQAPLDDTLADHMLALADLLEHRAPGFSLAAEGLMWLVLADLARLAGPRARVDMAAKSTLGWAEAAAEFIQTNYHRPIGVESVAAYVGFHSNHLGRLFRAHYGTTVQAWLVRTRIEKAKLLLRTTDRPVAEIARAVGYRSYPPFEKRFVAVVGQSPTAYQKGTYFQ